MKDEKRNNHDSIFWLKGEGMNRRCHNIDAIKELIEKGLSYQQIFRIARKYFRPKRIDEYYDIALDEVNNSDEESFMEKVKKVKIKPKKQVSSKMVEHEGYCLNCGKEIPENKKFCNEECVREYYKKKGE